MESDGRRGNGKGKKRRSRRKKKRRKVMKRRVELVGFNVPLNTKSVISETSLSRQSISLVVTTKQQQTENSSSSSSTEKV